MPIIPNYWEIEPAPSEPSNDSLRSDQGSAHVGSSSPQYVQQLRAFPELPPDQLYVADPSKTGSAIQAGSCLFDFRSAGSAWFDDTATQIGMFADARSANSEPQVPHQAFESASAFDSRSPYYQQHSESNVILSSGQSLNTFSQEQNPEFGSLSESYDFASPHPTIAEASYHGSADIPYETTHRSMGGNERDLSFSRFEGESAHCKELDNSLQAVPSITLDCISLAPRKREKAPRAPRKSKEERRESTVQRKSDYQQEHKDSKIDEQREANRESWRKYNAKRGPRKPLSPEQMRAKMDYNNRSRRERQERKRAKESKDHSVGSAVEDSDAETDDDEC